MSMSRSISNTVNLTRLFRCGQIAAWMWVALTGAVAAQAMPTVVADSLSGVPLVGATVYDFNGKAVGRSDGDGRLPDIPTNRYPIAVSFLGYNVKPVAHPVDTILLSENPTELPEFVMQSPRHKMLHILAYVREYSTLSTYTDTVFLFREKMVDYMLPAGAEVKYRGWTDPRLLTARSYYRFTNDRGLDSVGDESRHHFSWSDWVGAAPATPLPDRLHDAGCRADTLWGKYAPAEVWARNGDSISVDVNVLADQSARRWVPSIRQFFRDDLDFNSFRLRLAYDGIAGDAVSPRELTGYSFHIESMGRGHGMFRFNKPGEPFFVTTSAEVYVLDKEYVTVKEARKWEKWKFDIDEVGIYEPADAPPLPEEVNELVARVEELDSDAVRLDVIPDHRLAGNGNWRRNYRIERRALFLLKQLTGISAIKAHRNRNNKWKEFRESRKAQSAKSQE